MGTFASGFFGAVGSALHDKAEEHRANDQKIKDQQAQIYWDGIKSGNLSPEQLQYAQDQLQKIYGNSKPLKEMFKKFGSVIGMVHGKGGQGGGAAAPAGGAPQGGGMTPPPKVNQQDGPSGAVPIPLGKPGEGKPEPIPLGKPGEGPPPTLLSSAAQNPQEIPKSTQMSKPPSFADVVAAGHPSDAAQDERAMKFWKEQQKTIHQFKMEEVDAAAKAKAANPSGRPVMGPAVSVSNARELAKQGKTFLDKDGNPIDLTTLPDTMGLKNIVWGGKSYFEPFSPNSKVVTVGNETYAVSPMDVEALTTGAGTDLGQHRTGTSRDSVKGMDPVSGADVTRSSSQPITPGVNKQTPQATSGGGASKSRTTPPPRSSDLLPTNATAKRIAPVREAYTQLFGDPTQPSATSLKDFAHLADDPKAAQRVGQAVQLVLGGLEQEEKRSGSLATLLKNYGGVPQALLQSQLAVNKDIIGKLSPEETRAFNSIVSSFSTVMGLRSLTGASAAKFSVIALERDIPIPGVNAMSSAAFKDKMKRLAEEVYTGSRTVPLPESERQFIKQQVESGGETKKPTRMTAPPKSSAAPSIDDIINEAAKKKPKKAA